MTMSENEPGREADGDPGGAPGGDGDGGRGRLRGFLNHLIVFFLVMIVLVPVNFVLTPDRPWFVFLLVGWGAPLALHAAYAMGLFGSTGRGRR
ncbi:2TM domain-containing protein [Arenibaculum sp.]|jgi:uncharacterized RDD family membrane protein YckC|uniref:2TM domain-containing protein n=1 Tax=Arenibaculum sp. TaxID=2865862 RepID=UPI002E15021D|nr:2TM domain-containing protein [Arenibaculum sp.]